MTSLTVFLLDRIAEDEAAVQPPGRGSAVPSRGAHAPAPGRWNAERIRAECEAKRRIVKLAMLQEDLYRVRHDDFQQGATAAVLETLRHLAQVYADHPDFDRSWTL